MSSFLAEANTSKSATATIPPSSIVNEISYYDTLPVFVNYQTSAVKFPLTSSANYPYLQVSVKTLTELQVIFQQSVNDTLDSLGEPATPVGSRYEIVPAMNVPGDPTLLDTQTPSKMLYYEVTSPFFRLVVVNRSATQVGNLLLTTKLASSRPTDGLIQMDNILVGGLNPSSQPTLFKTDAEGRLKVDASITIEDITLSPNNDGVKVYGGVGGVGDAKLLNTDTTGKLNVILNDTKVGETGTPFIFIPTAANNTAAIYADGAQGTTIPNIGWQYINNPAASLKKINWYIYQSPLIETSYKVSQLENIYCVVNNLSTLIPYFTFYTRPTGTGDAQFWYKSRITFTASNTGGTGMKFLYTGEDPVLIHPEITGLNRIQLQFEPNASTKTLAQASEELIFSSTLQTDSSPSSAGVYNFIFQEYGIVWEKTKVFLPVEFGKLLIKGEITNFPVTQPVSGTIAVSNFPAAVTSVAVNNLAPIELKLDENNVYLQGISVTTSGIRNSLNWTPRQLIIISTPTTITAGDVVTNTEYPLEALNNTEVKYKNAIYLGSVNASVNTNPKLVFQYSDDETNWFSDGVSASFYKPAGGSTTWEFAFQRSGLGVKYVRLLAQTTTTINYLALNLSV
jgi:hypothetical protein